VFYEAIQITVKLNIHIDPGLPKNADHTCRPKQDQLVGHLDSGNWNTEVILTISSACTMRDTTQKDHS
jgi:hypothetical protein